MTKNVILEQSELNMITILNSVVQQTKTELMRQDEALQAGISLIENKYNATFNRETGTFDRED